MNGAIIGLGNIALNGHLPAWKSRKDFKIVAGIDSDKSRRDLCLKSESSSVTFSSLDQCNLTNIDFVDVCTPPHIHFAIAKQSLEKGYHVICEKPLVLSQKEMDALDKLSKEKSRVLFTVHNWKYAAICLKISELLDQKAIGEVKHCAWYVLRNGPSVTTDPNNWRLDPQKAGGGILIDHGWHAFYLVLGWLKKQPKTVHATLENRQYEDLPVEDTAKIKIEFETNGRGPLTSEIFLTWASRVRRNWGVIEGSRGIINIEDDHLKVSRNDSKTGAPEEIYRFESPLSQGSHHPDWFGCVIDEFSAELKDPSRRGENFKMAKSCLRLIDSSKESQQKNAIVIF